MSKKIISLLLTLVLAVSMVVVAAVSVSAEVDDEGRYVPTEGIETNRYYFYMPTDWYNDCAWTAGIYWWLGTDGAESWPGYNTHNADFTNVYYCDVPDDATTIIWNNFFDGGEDTESPDYAKAIQTVNIGSEYYSAGDCDIYDDAFFAEMEESFNGDKAALGKFADNFFMEEEYGFGLSFNYDNMIYVINPEMISINDLNGKSTCGGEWYFYYGNGEYGTYPTREAAAAKGKLYNTQYQPPKGGSDPTPDTPATTPTTPTGVEPSTHTAPYLTVNATSNYFPKATSEYNKDTKEVTVTYWMKSTKDVLDTQWYIHFDPKVLSYSSKNTAASVSPATGEAGMVNLASEDTIKFNATNLNLFDFTSKETAFAKVVFDVKDIASFAPTSTTVDLEVDVLRVSKLQADKPLTDPKEEVLLCNFSKVIDDEATKTVKVDRRTELTTSTFVEPTVAPSTVAPTTEEPTTEPLTTEAPDPSVLNLKVNAASNYFPKATAEYNKSTQEVVVTYWMKSAMDVLDLQWDLTYDSEILALSEKNTLESVCPVIADKATMNTGIKNTVKYNASNLYLFDFSSAEVPFAQFVFDVKDLKDIAPVETTINLNVEVLRVSELDPATQRSNPDKEIMLVNSGVVIENEQTASAGVAKRTELTPSTYVAPTTVAPTTVEEPTITAPETTQEPSETSPATTVAPTTAAPTTVAPTQETTAAPATNPTSATGTTSGGSTSDTPDTPVTPSNPNAVQTGDSSLAVIILSILIGATCVMFVLRKREMF